MNADTYACNGKEMMMMTMMMGYDDLFVWSCTCAMLMFGNVYASHTVFLPFDETEFCIQDRLHILIKCQ